MREEIPKLKEMMKELTGIKDRCKSESLKGSVNEVIFAIKDLCEYFDYD